jgi:hypothetical protein
LPDSCYALGGWALVKGTERPVKGYEKVRPCGTLQANPPSLPAGLFAAERFYGVKKILTVVSLCIILFFTVAEAGQMQLEINHLIDYVQDSGCTFIRNGKEHTPEEAAQHILKKYDHFKDKITSTEAFIAFCATKSILTNQPYKMRCPGQNIVESQDWLLMELRRFRKL